MDEEKETGAFKLDGSLTLDHIVSPVTLIFPDRSRQTCRNGAEVTAVRFDRPYAVKSVAAVDDEIGIILEAANDPE